LLLVFFMTSARLLIFASLVSSPSLLASPWKHICRSEGEGSFVRLDRGSLVFVESAQVETLSVGFASRGLAAMAPFVYTAAQPEASLDEINFVRTEGREELVYRFRMRPGTRRAVDPEQGESFVADFEVTRLRGEVLESLSDARLECIDGTRPRRRLE
jgi:hypothetical protein